MLTIDFGAKCRWRLHLCFNLDPFSLPSSLLQSEPPLGAQTLTSGLINQRLRHHIFCLICQNNNGKQTKKKKERESGVSLRLLQLVPVFSCRWPRGRWELAWAFPAGLSDDQVRVEQSRCGRSRQHCSLLTVSSTRAQHTGPFRCRYHHQPDKQTSVYVYVAGKTPRPNPPPPRSHYKGQLSFAQCRVFRSAG